MSLSIVLLVVYLLFLLFTLVSNSALFAGSQVPAEEQARASSGRAALVLAGATAGIAWMSEIMVGSIEPMAHELGLNNVFVGVFAVAIMGNAAAH